MCCRKFGTFRALSIHLCKSPHVTVARSSSSSEESDSESEDRRKSSSSEESESEDRRKIQRLFSANADFDQQGASLASASGTLSSQKCIAPPLPYFFLVAKRCMMNIISSFFFSSLGLNPAPPSDPCQRKPPFRSPSIEYRLLGLMGKQLEVEVPCRH